MRRVLYMLFCLFAAQAAWAVVPTEAIEAVRQRAESSSSEVSAADKAVIDKFILSALNDIFLSETSDAITQTRRQILEQKGTKGLSLYATAYVTSIREQLRSSAYTYIQQIDDPTRRLMVRRNLMILVAELRSLLLIEFGLGRIEDPDAVIRYWAIKSLAGDAIAAQLNSEVSTDPEAAKKIYQKLQTVIEKEKQPEILNMIAQFGLAWEGTQGTDLQKKLVQQRIQDYQECKTGNEWLDGEILKAIGKKYAQQKLPEDKATSARSFAELFSVVMQRWIQNDSNGGNKKILSDASVFQLISVMVEIEERVLPSMGITGVGLKRDLEGKRSLQTVYEQLFGSSTRKGIVQTRLGFEYQSSTEGVDGPPKLQPCPGTTKQETDEGGA